MYDLTNLAVKLGVNEDNTKMTRLISYPRSGSHWFRIMMELYLECPSLVQSFFNPNPTKVWGFHIHNRWINKPDVFEGPIKNLEKAIYLYRDPVDVIFSQIRYHKEPFDSQEIVDKYILEYSNHLDFYLNNKPGIKNLHFLKYEDLKLSPVVSFLSCIEFINEKVDEEKFLKIYSFCDKKLTKNLTPHDNQAMDNSEIFNNNATIKQKDDFVQRFSQLIKNKINL